MHERPYQFPPRTLTSASDNAMQERADVPRSKFVSTFSKLTSFDAGELIPFLVDEILPGDHMKYDITAFLRMATPLFPIFSTQRIDTHIFFVPNRLVWTNWRAFMGEQRAPSDSIAFTIPRLDFGAILSWTTFDYMGIPLGTNNHPISALPFRAYRLIYAEWFRDENVGTSGTFTSAQMGNGTDTLASTSSIQRRMKSHDYFTSCLPWPQKFTAPTVPLFGQAPVTGIGFPTASGNLPNTNIGALETGGGTTVYPFSFNSAGPDILMRTLATNEPQVFANLSASTVGVTVESLRQAFQIQRLLERDARGGTRYIEMVKSHFGVTSPDARMQRPEYIGGGSTPLNVTPIAQTATGGGGLGALGAAATAVGSHRASYAATEHGYVIGIISVKSELAYQQALNKMWTRQTRLDFYFPALAQLGEQAVLQREIRSANLSTDTDVFGYQERYAEYRYKPSRITGQFRSTYSTPLDTWHLSQEFGSLPVLDSTFIQEDPPLDRVVAIPAEPHFIFDSYFNLRCARPMPMFGVPGLIDHF